MPTYRIVNIMNGLYWNNDSGWGSADTADLFGEWEILGLSLPIDGRWEKII